MDHTPEEIVWTIHQRKRENAMAKNTSITATAIAMNALKPIVHFQIAMLRMWADSIERFAGNYEKGLQETATSVAQQSDRQRAA